MKKSYFFWLTITQHWLAALQCILLCFHNTFDGNGIFLQHRPTSLKKLCEVLLAPTQLRYKYTIVACPSSVKHEQGLCYSHVYILGGFVYHLDCTCFLSPTISIYYRSAEYLHHTQRSDILCTCNSKPS